MEVQVALPQSEDVTADAVTASLLATVEGQKDTEVTVEVKQEWNVEVEAIPLGASTEEVLEAVLAQCRLASPDCDVQVIETDRRALRDGGDRRRRLAGTAVNLAVLRTIGDGQTLQAQLPFEQGISVRGSVAPVGSHL